MILHFDGIQIEHKYKFSNKHVQEYEGVLYIGCTTIEYLLHGISNNSHI